MEYYTYFNIPALDYSVEKKETRRPGLVTYSHHYPPPSARMAGLSSSSSSSDSFKTAPSSPQPLSQPEQECRTLELDFTSGDSHFVRATGDETLYWTSTHKELSHPDLFARAVKTRERLIPDLKQTIAELSISRKRRLFNGGRLVYDLEPPEKRYELRLTGRRQAGTNRIVMAAWIWIQCSDKYSVRKMNKRIDELGWLKSSKWAPVYVHLNSILAGHHNPDNGSDLFDSRTGTKLGGGYQLHVDIAQSSEGDSMCGRLCRSRVTLESKIMDQSFSRIGGVLRVNDSIDVIITTAHGMLNYFITEILPLLEIPKPEEEDAFVESSDESDTDEEYLNELDRDLNNPDPPQTNALGYLDVSEIQHWESLTPFDTITYLAQAKQLASGSTWDLLFRDFDADYALLSSPSTTMNRSSSNHYGIEQESVGSRSNGIWTGDFSQPAPRRSRNIYSRSKIQNTENSGSESTR
ncbi:hypothetical protein F5Y19DRAFT_161915 [Xylariaceae sp. FL1651]|nr:hypothetical protein F5Y19DRAFT_161915 [Xylariaceae sp. FL1651]